MKYALFLKKSAEQELLALPKEQAFKIKDAILDLSHNPRPKGCKKLSGSLADYRIRIGDYRVVYSIADKVLTILVVKIAHRRDVYK